MTSGLGDFIVLGDVIRKTESCCPGARCLIAHRGNPHVALWNNDDPAKRFFDIYKPGQYLKLVFELYAARREKFIVFGLQMAPGSLQGFLFHSLLKKIRAVDYIVDFNLINADIITPPKGAYILDMHLHQLQDLLKVHFPKKDFSLSLPFTIEESERTSTSTNSKTKIGIHPWTRLDHPSRIWPFKNWAKTIEKVTINSEGKFQFVIFGKDKSFSAFRQYLLNSLEINCLKHITFIPADSVKQYIATIEALDIVLTVSTSTVPIGYALNKKMVILGAATLDLWIPQKDGIVCLYDTDSLFPPSDSFQQSRYFPSVNSIPVEHVVEALLKFQ
jgi:ADP-heptose:LPS heptosyltransferase